MRSLRTLLAFALLFVGTEIARAQSLAWAYAGTPDQILIGSAAGGGSPTVVWNSPTAANTSPWGIAYNPNDQRLYWTDTFTSARGVYRVGLDGSGFQQVFSYATALPSSLAIDPVANRLYFSASAPTNAIVRSEMDGTGQTNLIALSGAVNVWVAVDAAHRFLYWSESSANVIRRANLDGSPTIQDVVDLNSYAPGGTNGARGVAIDGAGRLSWLDSSTDFLYGLDISSYAGVPLTVGAGNQLVNLRSLTNGTASTTNGLATDGRRLYWTEGLTGFRGIYGADMNGANAGLLYGLGTSSSPLGITMVPEPATLLLAGLPAAFFGWRSWRRSKMPVRRR